MGWGQIGRSRGSACRQIPGLPLSLTLLNPTLKVLPEGPLSFVRKSPNIYFNKRGTWGIHVGAKTRSPLGGPVDKGCRKGAKNAGSRVG